MEYTNVERIVAKIDNDFNPNNSDWIPRVGAWVNDALAQLEVNQTETKRKKLKVINNVARSDCPLPNEITVYDANGCEIKLRDESACCGEKLNDADGSDSSTGVFEKTPQTITTERTNNNIPPTTIVLNQQAKSYPARYNVIELVEKQSSAKTYTRDNEKTISLNYDGESYITVVYKAPKTYKCDKYGCELPVIPDNGKLIEALVYYCMYKMLCRGYKHPVFNLGASQYGTNPYHIWIRTKDEAARSVINGEVDKDLDKLWRSALFINTFYP